MPLTIRRFEDRSRPVIVCDHCNDVIERAVDGNMLWSADVAVDPDMWFTHKACNHTFEQSYRGTTWRSMDLDVAMVRLTSNLGMDDEAWDFATARAMVLGLF